MKNTLKTPALSFLRSISPLFAAAALSFMFLLSCGGGGGSSTAPVASPSAPVFPAMTLTRDASGFNQPVHVTHAGDGSGRLFIVEKQGVIKIVRNGTVLPVPFLNITSIVKSSGSEQGLLSVAFPPGFSAKRYFYVDYTALTGVVGDTILARYDLTADPDVADATGGELLLTVAQPFENHNGGQVAFGPDGFLYVAMGDGGSAGDPSNNAQNLTALLGKILRIDVESGVLPYVIPASNPFFNNQSVSREIWSYGLRNPWRFSFDRATGDLYIADVGQNTFEEVDFQPAASPGGENFGWNIMEGLHCFNNPNCSQTGFTLPVAEYDHQSGDCSVTGGFVYRGSQYPALQGIYLYGDFCSGRIWGLRRSGTAWQNQLLLDTPLQISTFGEDEAGNLYLADFTSGDIYRIDVL